MLEWVCPRCNRAVDPAFDACPFCHDQGSNAGENAAEPLAPLAAVGRRVRVVRREPFQWGDIERGFRFGLGFVAACACAYFVLFLIAYFLNRHEWVEALGRWLYR